MWSIRRRLLTWLVSGVLISGFTATLAIYVQAREEVDEFFDGQLRQIALSLRDQKDLSVAEATPQADAEQDEDIVASAWDVNGRPIFGLARVRPVPLSITTASDRRAGTARRGEPTWSPGAAAR